MDSYADNLARVRTLYHERKLPLRQLAVASGLAFNTVYTCVRGTTKQPQSETVQRLLRVLESPPEDADTLRAYRELDADAKAIVRTLIEYLRSQQS